MFQEGIHAHGHRAPPVGIPHKDRIVLINGVQVLLQLGTGIFPKLSLCFLCTCHIVLAVFTYGFDLEQIAADSLLHKLRHPLGIAFRQIHDAAVPIVLTFPGVIYNQVCHVVSSFHCISFRAASLF